MTVWTMEVLTIPRARGETLPDNDVLAQRRLSARNPPAVTAAYPKSTFAIIKCLLKLSRTWVYLYEIRSNAKTLIGIFRVLNVRARSNTNVTSKSGQLESDIHMCA